MTEPNFRFYDVDRKKFQVSLNFVNDDDDDDEESVCFAIEDSESSRFGEDCGRGFFWKSVGCSEVFFPRKSWRPFVLIEEIPGIVEDAAVKKIFCKS